MVGIGRRGEASICISVITFIYNCLKSSKSLVVSNKTTYFVYPLNKDESLCPVQEEVNNSSCPPVFMFFMFCFI